MAFDAGPDDPVEIVVAPEPFTTRVERLEAREGATLAEILTEACKLEVLDPQDLVRSELYLDGERLLDRAAALDLTPAPGQLLNIVVLPQGGGGGGGNKVLSTILEVALIAATAWIAGPAGAALGNSIAGLGTTAGTAAFTAASAAVRVGAILALTAGVSEIQAPLSGSAPVSFEEFGS